MQDANGWRIFGPGTAQEEQKELLAQKTTTTTAELCLECDSFSCNVKAFYLKGGNTFLKKYPKVGVLVLSK